LWESVLPTELCRLPDELARVGALLDDPAFFIPFAPFFDPQLGRPSTPMETYLRLMFLKFRYRLGYEALCREVADSISWRRFCRIALDGSVPHPTTLMKITSRCGDDAVAALNEGLLAKASAAKLLRTNKVRADTTVVEADVGYPTDSGLLAKGIGAMARTVARIKAAGGGRARKPATGAARRVVAPARSPRSCGCAVRSSAIRLRPRCGGSPGISRHRRRRDARCRRGAAQRQTGMARCDRGTQGPAAAGDQPPDNRSETHPEGGGADPQPPGRGDARVGQPAGQPA
jgi:transposase, IS5 family